MKYKIGAIAGKFRIFHIAHEQLIKTASAKCELLIIFVCDISKVNRLISLKQTINCIKQYTIDNQINAKIISLNNEELAQTIDNPIKWDKLLIKKVQNLEVVFDSKEKYGNIILKNEYINLDVSDQISASEIEINPLNNQQLINKYYLSKYLKIKNQN